MKKTTVVLSAILLMLLFSGCIYVGVSKSNSPPIELSATELWQSYREDVAKADALYNGKIVKVTGTVVRVGEFMKMPCVSMKIEGSTEYEDLVFLFEDDTYAQEIQGIQRGDTVTIYGDCSGTKMRGAITIWESGIKTDYICVWINDCYFDE